VVDKEVGSGEVSTRTLGAASSSGVVTPSNDSKDSIFLFHDQGEKAY
jgi:hypothetical protein